MAGWLVASADPVADLWWPLRSCRKQPSVFHLSHGRTGILCHRDEQSLQ
jgi:hypothetical protein